MPNCESFSLSPIVGSRHGRLACLSIGWLLCGCQPAPLTASPTPPPSADRNELRRQGTHLFEQTYERMPQAKAGLHCSSCHLQGGTAAGAASLVGVARHYPEPASGSADSLSLAERVNGCLQQSLNAPPLPPDSRELQALLAYIEGLEGDPPPARGITALPAPPTKPDSARGQALYAANCASCHRPDGSGTYEEKTYRYPAVWGERSFTSGSEMARVDKLAGFIYVKMPLGQGKTLTPEECQHIAAYLAAQARPSGPIGSQEAPPTR